MSDNASHPPIYNKRRHSDPACRSTYSPAAAQEFKPLFDTMIASLKDVLLTETQTGYRANTLYIKVNDALKWLLENDPDKDKYALFRTRIAVKKLPEGVRIEYKRTISHILQRAAETGHSLTWKDDFLKWVETAQPYEIFDRKNVLVTPEQKKFVENYMFQLQSESSEVEITSDSVKVMR